MKIDEKRTRELIRESGRTLDQFCKDTGIKNYNLSKYLHGSNIPKDVMERIADDLGVTIYELMELRGFY